MVKIRLRRIGGKGNPFYRIIVADVNSPRNGRFIEELGYYDPNKKPAEVKVDMDKVNDWIRKGAQPTDSVRKILKTASQEAPAAAVAEATAEATAEAAEAPADAE